MEFKGTGSIPLAIVAGASLAFFALVGFEDSVNVAEETHDPSKNFPRVLFIGVAITGTVYVLVAFTASTVVPTSQLAGSSAPLLEVVKEGPIAVPTVLFSLIALTAVTNSALINLIMGSASCTAWPIRASFRVPSAMCIDPGALRSLRLSSLP